MRWNASKATSRHELRQCCQPPLAAKLIGLIGLIG
jgi:hypothetical protein